MKIGVSTSCFYPLLTEKSLLKVAQSNASVTEIFFNAECELKKEFVTVLKNICDQYDLSVKSVHPTGSLAESFNLFSAYDRRYDETMEKFKRYAEIVSSMGGKYIILHGGKPNNVLDDRGYFERFYKISETLKQEGGILLQENVVNFRAGNIDFLKRMSDYLGDNANFCIDVKQSVRGGYSPFDAVRLLGKKVKHIHISDNNEKSDCLLPLDGNFDFKAFFETALSCGFSGDAIIEVYSEAYKDYDEIFSSFNRLNDSLKGII